MARQSRAWQDNPGVSEADQVLARQSRARKAVQSEQGSQGRSKEVHVLQGSPGRSEEVQGMAR